MPTENDHKNAQHRTPCRRHFMASLVIAIMVALATLISSSPSQARVVALLYDDSRSMKQKDKVANFAAQLLVSILDGRQGQDRLLTAIMSEVRHGRQRSIVAQNISSPQSQRNLIRHIARNWRPRGGTPHEQILWLLQRIQSMQQQNEEAFLVIITDGVFNDPPSADTFRQRLNEIKNGLKGPLRVAFVLIGPEAKSLDTHYVGQTVGDVVESQGIRKALLEIFNGDEKDGRYDVSTARDFISSFKEIIAHISSTDLRGINKYIEFEDNSIKITSPLSIKRIISVSFGEVGKSLVKPDVRQIGPTQHFSLQAAMPGKDRLRGWRGTQLRSQADHMLFNPFKPAGTYTLPYDAPPTQDNVLLLFQVAARLQAALVDDQGRPFAQRNGVYLVPRGAKAFIRLSVLDQDANGRVHEVALDAFRGQVALRARVTLNDGSDRFVDFAQNENNAPLETDGVSGGAIVGQMVARGFVRTFAPVIHFEVVDLSQAMSMQLEPREPCASCGPEEIQVTLRPKEKVHALADVIIDHDLPLGANYQVRVVKPAKGVKLLLGDSGRPVPEKLPLRAGRHQVKMLLQLSGDARQWLKKGARTFELEIAGNDPKGILPPLKLKRRVRIEVPEVKLAIVGTSKKAADNNVLAVDVQELNRGEEYIRFKLFNALNDPKPEEFSIDTGSWLLDWLVPSDVDIKGQEGLIKPRSRLLCGCLLYFFQNRQRYTVQWKSEDGLQQARADAALDIRFPFVWQGAIECLKFLMLLLGIAYLIMAILFWLNAVTFPRGSGLLVREGSGRRAREYPVSFPPSWKNFTLLKALLWPIWGVPHQRAQMEGLMFTARRGGAYLDLEKSSDKSTFVNRKGKNIKDLIEQKRKRKKRGRIPPETVSWNDVFRRRFGRRDQILKLKKQL